MTESRQEEPKTRDDARRCLAWRTSWSMPFTWEPRNTLTRVTTRPFCHRQVAREGVRRLRGEFQSLLASDACIILAGIASDIGCFVSYLAARREIQRIDQHGPHFVPLQYSQLALSGVEGRIQNEKSAVDSQVKGRTVAAPRSIMLHPSRERWTGSGSSSPALCCFARPSLLVRISPY